MPRRSRDAAAATRRSIVSSATSLGSTLGLEAVSIGVLAKDVGLTRSGVTRHFATKEELQLAAVEDAIRSFRAEVWAPVADERPGRARLTALMRSWLSYLERDVFPGGCFLTAASLEFDGRPGAVRNAITEVWDGWMRHLEREVATAQAAGELADERDPAQIVFELHGHVMAGNWANQLFGDSDALERAAAAAERTLAAPAGARSAAATR